MVRKTLLFTTFLTLLIAGVSQAQWAFNYNYNRNSVFVEYAARGIPYSINYDRIFRFGEEINYSYRIGASIYDSRISGSLGINAFAGDGDHHPEMSIVVHPSAKVGFRPLKQLIPTNIQSNFMGTVGYRYQRFDRRGPVIKLAAGTMFSYKPSAGLVSAFRPRLYSSISIGYSF